MEQVFLVLKVYIPLMLWYIEVGTARVMFITKWHPESKFHKYLTDPGESFHFHCRVILEHDDIR